MADPLRILREFNANKKPIIEKNGQIIFGELSWPKTVKTNFLVKGSGKGSAPKDYYSLECLLFFLKNAELQHPLYVNQAAAKNIQAVRRPDRKELLKYLNGETNHSISIDESAITTTVKRERNQPEVVKKIKLEGSNIRGAGSVTAVSFSDSNATEPNRPVIKEEMDPFDLPPTPPNRSLFADNYSSRETSSSSVSPQSNELEKDPLDLSPTPPNRSLFADNPSNHIVSLPPELIQSVKEKRHRWQRKRDSLPPMPCIPLSPNRSLATDHLSNHEVSHSSTLHQSIKVEKDPISLPTAPSVPLSSNRNLAADHLSSHGVSYPSTLFQSIKVEKDPLPPMPSISFSPNRSSVSDNFSRHEASYPPKLLQSIKVEKDPFY